MSKPLRLISIASEIQETPLHSPFVTSQGRADRARCLSIRFRLSNGQEAFGEATPVEYVTGETVESVQKTVERIAPQLIGMEIERYRTLLDTILECAPAEPSARCGLEMATLEAWSLAKGLPLQSLWGGESDSVESDLTIPIVPEAGEIAAFAYATGIRVFKIKIGGGTLEEDFARVSAVRQAAPEAVLRVDANQALTPDQAIHFVHRLLEEGTHIQLLEQPVPMHDWEGLARVAEASPVPIFADESVRSPQDALRLVGTPVQGFNLKINKCGISGVLDIISIAKAAGRKLMLGCMLETRRSIALSLALACGTGAFDYVDLDSHLLLNEVGTNTHFWQEGAKMALVFPERN